MIWGNLVKRGQRTMHENEPGDIAATRGIIVVIGFLILIGLIMWMMQEISDQDQNGGTVIRPKMIVGFLHTLFDVRT